MKYFILVFAVLQFHSSYGSFSDFEKKFLQQPEKLEAWHVLSDEVDLWTDRIGMPIDERIKETVIVLNLMGFTTSASCEGHIDWGLPYPWIDFAVNDKEFFNIQNELMEIQKQINGYGDFKDLTDEELQEVSNLNKQRLALFSELYRNTQTKLLPIYALLEKFYSKKKKHYDCVICFPDKYLSRMQSLGGQWKYVRTPEQKKNKLKKYQEEMSQFTDFLIREYLRQ